MRPFFRRRFSWLAMMIVHRLIFSGIVKLFGIDFGWWMGSLPLDGAGEAAFNGNRFRISKIAADFRCVGDPVVIPIEIFPEVRG